METENLINTGFVLKIILFLIITLDYFGGVIDYIFLNFKYESGFFLLILLIYYVLYLVLSCFYIYFIAFRKCLRLVFATIG